MPETTNAVDRGGKKFFFPGGPAFVVLPALRIRYTPGKARKEPMPGDEEAPLPVYRMLNKGEFLSGQYLEALVLLPVRDSRCCGSLGVLGQSAGGQPGQ